MAKAKDINDSAGVTAYIQKLHQPLSELIEAIRQVVLSTDPAIGEQIKWNSPSFFYTGAMAPFDPKEYRRDIVVVNINRRNEVLLIFPTGIKVKDTSPILEGNYTDGRRMVSIYDINDLKAKAQQLQRVIPEWLRLIEV